MPWLDRGGACNANQSAEARPAAILISASNEIRPRRQRISFMKQADVPLAMCETNRCDFLARAKTYLGRIIRL